jgi:lantibiotic modifying enzyme
MEQDWTKVLSTRNPVTAEMAKGLLRENGIEAVELNKRDSCYGNFGNIEVYCHASQVVTALEVLKELRNE